jgi:hypothetical protein
MMSGKLYLHNLSLNFAKSFSSAKWDFSNQKLINTFRTKNINLILSNRPILPNHFEVHQTTSETESHEDERS